MEVLYQTVTYMSNCVTVVLHNK